MAPDYSRVAEVYARSRPGYPAELFEFLASVVDPRRVAWDCATGSGQAAVDLTRHFPRVIATDLGVEQISEAPPHPRISYHVASAEESGLADGEVDLVTVATAIHWLDLDRFFAEARRVLRPGGVLAAWTYHVGHMEPPFDELFGRFVGETLRPYFARGADLVDQRYEGLTLPGEEIATAPYHVSATWSLARVVTFVRSWSGTQRYNEQRGESPLPGFAAELE